jgi:hypothetical protein
MKRANDDLEEAYDDELDNTPLRKQLSSLPTTTIDDTPSSSKKNKRRVLDGMVAEYNTNHDFIRKREETLNLEEKKGCDAKCRRGGRMVCTALIYTEPILQGVVVITATAGTYFSMLKQGQIQIQLF